MSNEPPPEFGADNDDTTTSDSMYASVIAPVTDISLDDDDDDDNPFGISTPSKKPPTDTVKPLADDENKIFQENSKATVDIDDDDPFGEKHAYGNIPSSRVSPQASATVLETTPVNQESPSVSPGSKINSPQPGRATSPFESQHSSTSVSKTSETTTTSKPVQKRSEDHNIEITVSDPTKVGDGMSSYMTYRVTTKTTLTIFKTSEFSVNRRFSDFLGLHAKLVHKHLHVGIIIPTPPEKDSLSMAKIKISKDDSLPSDFIDRRRALLERYLNRLAKNDKLLADSDVVEFLETPSELPKATSTQALSSAGVARAMSNISGSLAKLTTKTNEQDQWFEENHVFVAGLQTHFKNLCNQFNTLFTHRKEAGHILKQFSTSLNHLATVEEHTLLSSTLIELANLEEKLEQINSEEVLKEYSVLTELIKEYISLLDMVQVAFSERIKIHQQWLSNEETLKKKRDAKIKLDQNPKAADKIPQAEKEIREWEEKVEHSKEEFENISTTIKQEMELFEQTRVDDFKKSFDIYLKNLLEQQEKILQLWEGYLPEANKITV